MKTLIVSLFATVALLGCASNSSSSGDEVAANDSGKTCRMVKVTGSRVPQRVCRTAAERRAEQEAAQETMSTIQTNSSNTTPQ